MSCRSLPGPSKPRAAAEQSGRDPASCRLLGRAASRNSCIVYPQMEGSLCRRSLPGLTRSVNVSPPKAGILLCSPVYLSNSAGLWTLETFVDLSCCGDPCQSPLGQDFTGDRDAGRVWGAAHRGRGRPRGKLGPCCSSALGRPCTAPQNSLRLGGLAALS